MHGHCHQKALDTLNDKEIGQLFAEKHVFDKMGLEDRHPDTGCCGMAGAFGYEKENGHYAVGLAAGERVLLPEVRQAPRDEIIVADGFSCQEQVRQQTDRTALHVAHVLRFAQRGGEALAGEMPEAAIVSARRRELRLGMAKAALLVGAATLFGGWALWKLSSGRHTDSRVKEAIDHAR